MLQEEDKTSGQSQILPNKATDNLHEFTQCEDLYKLLYVKDNCLKKTKRGKTENLQNI